jgi:large subunit ribosomal protein L24
MKSKFSTSWSSSVQKRKQHKYLANAPLHKKHKFLSANLSKELRKKHGKRNLPLRKGDEVLVMRGSFKKKKAKITSINLIRSVVYLENIQRSKKDGTKVNIPFNSSNLQIININADDKKRKIGRKEDTDKKTSSNKETKEKENASDKKASV